MSAGASALGCGAVNLGAVGCSTRGGVSADTGGVGALGCGGAADWLAATGAAGCSARGAAAARSRSDWATLKKLLPYLWQYRWRVVIALAGRTGTFH